MAVFSYDKKKQFEEQCQLKNFARVLLLIIQRVRWVLNDPNLLCVGLDGWSCLPVSSVENTAAGPTKCKEPFSPPSLSVSRVIEKADVGFVLWQALRHCRELLLKALVLINVVEKPKFVLSMNYALEKLSRLFDTREILRKAGLQLASVQWPPLGFGESPFPPYAVDIALEVFLSGGSYTRLPVLLEEVVKQVNETEVAVALKLDDKDRQILQRRIEIEVLTMWALSECKKDQASVRYTTGIVSFVVFNEFRLEAIYDLQRFQIVDAEILVGTKTFGLDISRVFNIAFLNFLSQALSLIDAKYQLTLEQLKTRIREVWKKVDFKSFSLGSNDSENQTTRNIVTFLENSLCSLMCIEDVFLKQDYTTRVPLDIIPIAEQDQVFLEKTTQSTMGHEQSKQDSVVTQVFSKEASENVLLSTRDYFFECLRIGRWVSGSIILAVLRDQALRAKNFSRVFPGCIFSCREVGRRNAVGMDSESVLGCKESSIKALDLCIAPCFDPSCGDLLSPLLVLLFECPALERFFDPHGYLRTMLSQENITGPSLSDCSTEGESVTLSQKLVGAGAVLRIGFETFTSFWKIILWPISPLMWILESLDSIRRCPKDTNENETLRQMVESTIPLDLAFIYNAMKKDKSWIFLQTFSANHLEMSLWTHHAAGCLSTLLLATLGSYLKMSQYPSTYTPSVELYNNVVSLNGTVKPNPRMLKWIYYKNYIVMLRVDSFEGNLRISFNSLNENQESSWVSLSGNALDTHLAAAIATGGCGFSGLLQLLSYLKYMAFLHLCGEIFTSYNLEPSHKFRSFVEASLPFEENSPTPYKTVFDPPTLPNDWFHDTNSSTQTTQSCRVQFITPRATPQLTQFLHTVRQNFSLNKAGELKRSMILVYRSYGDVILLLRIETVAAQRLESCRLLILRVSPSVELVTHFLLDVPSVNLLEGQDTDKETLNLAVKSYIEDIHKALKRLEVSIRHSVTLAQLPLEIFPMYLCDIKFEMHPFDKLSFVCLPYGPFGESFYHHLGWSPTYFSNFFDSSRLKLYVNYCRSDGVELVLDSQYGARLPTFRHGNLKTDLLLSVTPECSLRLEPCMNSSDQNIRIKKLTLFVKEASEGNLSATYLYLAKQLSILSFFLKGSRELERLEMLRKDIVVLRTSPCVLEVLWIPWAFECPYSGSFSSEAQQSNCHFELPPVKFMWTSNDEPSQDTSQEVVVSKDGVTLRIFNSLLHPVLKNSIAMLETLADNRRLISPWTIIRYIICSFEFHVSMSLLVSHTNQNMYRELGLDPPRRDGLLFPGHLCWCQKRCGSLGMEELVLDLEDSMRSIPGPLARIIDRIELTCRLNLTETLMEDVLDHLRPAFCISFFLKVQAKSGFELSSGFIVESLNETLSLFSGALSALYEDHDGVSNLDTSFYFSSVLPYRIQHSKAETTCPVPCPKKPELLSRTYQALVIPTRFLTSFLIPLLDGVVLWLNAITAACTVNPRGSASRTGVLCSSNQKSFPMEEKNNGPANGSTSHHLLCIGSVRWTQSTVTIASQSGPANHTNLPENTFSGLLYPNGLRMPNSALPQTMFPFEGLQNDAGSKSHTLDIALAATPKDVLKSDHFSTVRYSYLAHSSLFSKLECPSPTGSVPPTSNAPGCDTSHLSYGFYVCHWNIVRQYYTKVLQFSGTTFPRIFYLEWPKWPCEFNVNLLPLPGLSCLTNVGKSSPHALSSFIPSFLTYYQLVKQRWQRRFQIKDETIHYTQTLNHLNETILLSYWDLCPDALILPYEAETVRVNNDLFNENLTVRKRINSDTLSHPLKRRLIEEADQQRMNLVVEQEEFTFKNDKPCLDPVDSLKDALIDSVYHHASSSFSSPEQEVKLHDHDGKTFDQWIFFKPDASAVYQRCVDMSKFHSDTLSLRETTCWVPPLKPHSVRLTHQTEIEVSYHCLLEMRTVPASVEWSVVSKYSRTLSHELAWGGFALFVSLFQRNLLADVIHDIACLLDLALCNAEQYMSTVKSSLQLIGLTNSSGVASWTDLLHVPFFKFIFSSPPESRQGCSFPLFHFRMVIWKCLPFFSSYIQSHIRSVNTSDVLSITHERQHMAQLIPQSFNFPVSLSLGAQTNQDITLCYHFSLENILERLSRITSSKQRRTPPGGNYPLSLPRPLSLRLAQLVLSSFPYNALEFVFQSLSQNYIPAHSAP